MTTFAGQMDFSGPQPFNVSVADEGAGIDGAGVLGPSIPVVAQELTPEPQLYPAAGRGMRGDGAIR